MCRLKTRRVFCWAPCITTLNQNPRPRPSPHLPDMALAARRHHPRACPPARRQPRPPRAAAASSSSSDALLSLPLLPLGPCLPTCAGRITVYEPSFKAAVALALAEAAASGKVRKKSNGARVAVPDSARVSPRHPRRRLL